MRKILFLKGVPKKTKFEKKIKSFLTTLKHPKTHSKTFLRSTIFFGPLFPKYQHFVALNAHISEMRAEIENVEPYNFILLNVVCLSNLFYTI